MGLGRVKSCMSLYVCSNYCKHCSSNAPAGRQAEKRKPHQCRLRLAVFLPRHTRAQRNGKHELLPHGMANVDGVSTKPLEKNSGHKWVKVNTHVIPHDHLQYHEILRIPHQFSATTHVKNRPGGVPEAGSPKRRRHCCRRHLSSTRSGRRRAPSLLLCTLAHKVGKALERIPLKSILIASEMLANLLKLSHVAGTKSLELATPLVQAPYDVLRNNIGRLTKRPKFAVGQTALCAVAASYSRHLQKRRWHPLALGGSRHLLGMCPGNPETGKADCVR